MLPTTFAPLGILRVPLPDAAVRCAVSGAAHAGSTSVSYTGVVEQWTPSGYQQIALVTQATATDPLASVPLTTPLGAHGVIGDYIQSWSTLTTAGIRTTTGTGTAVASVPGVVTVTTQPLREDAAGVPDRSPRPRSPWASCRAAARDAR